MSTPRIVQKFGGTSVGSVEAIRRVGSIVKDARARRPIVVVSAVGGVTNKLFRLADLALARAEWEREFDALATQHRTIERELSISVPEVETLLSELHDLVRGIALIRERTPRTLDYLA